MDTQTQMDKVTCSCGHQDEYPEGYLTEQAKKEYKCKACRQPVLENKIAEKTNQGRRLLTEG